MKLHVLLLLCCVLLIAGCGNNPSQKKEPKADTARSIQFLPPEIPAVLTDPTQRADFLAMHYWDKFNFADTTLIANADFTEQAFVDFLPVLFNSRQAAQGIAKMFDGAMAGNRRMFDHFSDMAERYLADPNSPMRNEDLHIIMLNYLIASDKIEEIEKVRPKYLLEMAMKNRPGDMAADFIYTLANGERGRLSQIKSEYTILFFNNPDCHDCQRVKAYISASPVLQVQKGRLAILSLYPDEEVELWRKTEYPSDWINAYDATHTLKEQQLYDLKAIPTLYLLDEHKRVILKDVPVQIIEGWLAENGGK